MVQILLEKNYNPPLSPSPMTNERWMELVQTVESCLEARDVHWICSFVSLDCTRSLCIFEANYTEAVRTAYREAKASFNRVWRAQIGSGLSNDTIDCLSPVVAEVSYNPPVTKEQWEQAQQMAQPCFKELQICQLTSYLAATGEQGVCIFSAPSAEAVRNLYRKLGLAFDCVWRSRLFIP
ncbi:MAG: nickel-binding protein [Cyanobacteriota bacterium]